MVMIMTTEMKLIYDNKREPYWIEDEVRDQVGPSFHLRVHASHTQSSFIGRADFLWMDENKEVLKLADIRLNHEAVIHFRKFKPLWIFSPIGRKDWNCQRLGLGTQLLKHSLDCVKAMRKEIANANPDLVAENSKYVMQITGDNQEGKNQLDAFITRSKLAHQK